MPFTTSAAKYNTAAPASYPIASAAPSNQHHKSAAPESVRQSSLNGAFNGSGLNAVAAGAPNGGAVGKRDDKKNNEKLSSLDAKHLPNVPDEVLEVTKDPQECYFAMQKLKEGAPKLVAFYKAIMLYVQDVGDVVNKQMAESKDTKSDSHMASLVVQRKLIELREKFAGKELKAEVFPEKLSDTKSHSNSHSKISNEVPIAQQIFALIEILEPAYIIAWLGLRETITNLPKDTPVTIPAMEKKLFELHELVKNLEKWFAENEIAILNLRIQFPLVNSLGVMLEFNDELIGQFYSAKKSKTDLVKFFDETREVLSPSLTPQEQTIVKVLRLTSEEKAVIEARRANPNTLLTLKQKEVLEALKLTPEDEKLMESISQAKLPLALQLKAHQEKIQTLLDNQYTLKKYLNKIHGDAGTNNPYLLAAKNKILQMIWLKKLSKGYSIDSFTDKYLHGAKPLENYELLQNVEKYIQASKKLEKLKQEINKLQKLAEINPEYAAKLKVKEDELQAVQAEFDNSYRQLQGEASCKPFFEGNKFNLKGFLDSQIADLERSFQNKGDVGCCCGLFSCACVSDDDTDPAVRYIETSIELADAYHAPLHEWNLMLEKLNFYSEKDYSEIRFRSIVDQLPRLLFLINSLPENEPLRKLLQRHLIDDKSVPIVYPLLNMGLLGKPLEEIKVKLCEMVKARHGAEIALEIQRKLEIQALEFAVQQGELLAQAKAETPVFREHVFPGLNASCTELFVYNGIGWREILGHCQRMYRTDSLFFLSEIYSVLIILGGNLNLIGALPAIEEISYESFSKTNVNLSDEKNAEHNKKQLEKIAQSYQISYEVLLAYLQAKISNIIETFILPTGKQSRIGADGKPIKYSTNEINISNSHREQFYTCYKQGNLNEAFRVCIVEIVVNFLGKNFSDTERERQWLKAAEPLLRAERNIRKKQAVNEINEALQLLIEQLNQQQNPVQKLLDLKNNLNNFLQNENLLQDTLMVLVCLQEIKNHIRENVSVNPSYGVCEKSIDRIMFFDEKTIEDTKTLVAAKNAADVKMAETAKAAADAKAAIGIDAKTAATMTSAALQKAADATKSAESAAATAKAAANEAERAAGRIEEMEPKLMAEFLIRQPDMRPASGFISAHMIPKQGPKLTNSTESVRASMAAASPPSIGKPVLVVAERDNKDSPNRTPGLLAIGTDIRSSPSGSANKMVVHTIPAVGVAGNTNTNPLKRSHTSAGGLVAAAAVAHASAPTNGDVKHHGRVVSDGTGPNILGSAAFSSAAFLFSSKSGSPAGEAVAAAAHTSPQPQPSTLAPSSGGSEHNNSATPSPSGKSATSPVVSTKDLIEAQAPVAGAAAVGTGGIGQPSGQILPKPPLMIR